MLCLTQVQKSHGITINGTTSIIFYDTRKEFKWRNLFVSSGALAMNWWPFPYVTFAPVDMANDKQFARKEMLNERPVSSVMAHELTHTYQAEQLNLFGPNSTRTGALHEECWRG